MNIIRKYQTIAPYGRKKEGNELCRQIKKHQQEENILFLETYYVIQPILLKIQMIGISN